MKTLKGIEARLAAIKKEIDTRGAELKAEELGKLEKETNDLTEERAGLIAAAEKRNGILDNIRRGAGTVVRGFNDPSADPVEPQRGATARNTVRLL
jgi:hypothetical protein